MEELIEFLEDLRKVGFLTNQTNNKFKKIIEKLKSTDIQFNELETLKSGGRISPVGNHSFKWVEMSSRCSHLVTSEGNSLDPIFLLRYSWKPYVKLKTLPTLDWSIIPKGYNWLVCSKDGASFVFANEPYDTRDSWHAIANPSLPAIRVDQLTCFDRGDCYWKESLVQRLGEADD